MLPRWEREAQLRQRLTQNAVEGLLRALLVRHASCMCKGEGADACCSVGHKGIFGHEFLEFELHPDGKLMYTNNSQYKNAQKIRKQVYVGDAVLEEVRRIIADSEITKCAAALPPLPLILLRQMGPS